ncbi:unnamed protein product, partial [Ectocarpus fasciculatus]
SWLSNTWVRPDAKISAAVGVRPELVFPPAGVLCTVVVATDVGGEGDLFVARAD